MVIVYTFILLRLYDEKARKKVEYFNFKKITKQ